MRLVLFGVAFLLAASLPAQTCIYTWGTNPFGTIGLGGQGPELLDAPGGGLFHRRHVLIPAAVFQNVPYRITDVSIGVRDGWRRLRCDELTMRIGHTTRTQLSPIFAQNITSPLQDVIVARDHVWLEGIGTSWVPLGLQQPFQFLPGQGDVLIEIVTRGAAVLEQVAYTGLGDANIGRMIGDSDVVLPTVANNSIQNAPRFRLCVDHPEMSLLGTPCSGSTNAPPQLGLAGEPSLGNQTTFWLGNAPANSLALLAFGFDSRPPFPIDLGSQGAPGCRQYFPVVVTAAVITDNLGLGQHVVQIPNNPALAGTIVLGQYVALRPGSNSLGVMTSNYGRLLIGR